MEILYYNIRNIGNRNNVFNEVIFFAYKINNSDKLKIASMSNSYCNIEFIKQSKAQNIDDLKTNKDEQLAYFIQRYNHSN